MSTGTDSPLPGRKELRSGLYTVLVCVLGITSLFLVVQHIVSTIRTESGWVYDVVAAPPDAIEEAMNAIQSGRDCRLQHVVATEHRAVAVFKCWSEPLMEEKP